MSKPSCRLMNQVRQVVITTSYLGGRACGRLGWRVGSTSSLLTVAISSRHSSMLGSSLYSTLLAMMYSPDCSQWACQLMPVRF